MTDARTTPYDFCSTRMPNAAGSSVTGLLMAADMPQHSRPRAGGSPGQQVAPTLLQAVERRPDERREHRERGRRYQQEQHDPAAGLIHGRAEEDRPGQGDGHEGVSRPAGRGELDQRGQAGAAGPRCARHPVHQAAGLAGRRGANPRAGPHRAARGAGRVTVRRIASDIRM